MIYELKPAQMDATRIIAVGTMDPYNGQPITLEGGTQVVASNYMLSRAPVNPNVGDYWVVDENGVTTIAAKAVFEKRWRPVLAVREVKVGEVDSD